MNIEAVIFDKDGVLADSEKLKAQAWRQTLQDYGVESGFNWYLQNLGPSDISLASMATDVFAFDTDPQLVAAKWNTNYRSLEHCAEPITENLDILTLLADRYAIAIASSMDKATIVAKMERFGYLKFVSACVSGEDVPRNKPAPDVYLAAAAALGVKPPQCVAIEDSPTGVSAAKAAGMYCLGYRNALYDLDLTEADEIVSDLSSAEILSAVLRPGLAKR